MATFACPNGHQSADPEWCDTCGARLTGGAPAAAPAASPSPAPVVPNPTGAPTALLGRPTSCPHCGALNPPDNLFCESCGYDFTTGQAPPAPDVGAPAAAPAATSGSPRWVVIVEVDPRWFALKGALADQPCPPPSSSTVALAQRTALIGRTSHTRVVRPEITLDADTGVSRRHAQFVIDGDQLTVVDLSSTNGTYVVEAAHEPSDATQPLTPGVPSELHDGDRVYVGAWTRLTVRSV